MNPRILVVSLVALLAHTPASARAANDARPVRGATDGVFDVPTKRVVVADLNLAHPEGAAALRRRLDAAVLSISGGGNGSQGSELRAARAKARAQADALIAAARS